MGWCKLLKQTDCFENFNILHNKSPICLPVSGTFLAAKVLLNCFLADMKMHI